MRRIVVLLFLLPGVGVAQGDVPEEPDTRYTYVNAVQVVVSLHSGMLNSPEVYGDLEFYESLILDRLSESDVEVLPEGNRFTADSSWANPVSLEFLLLVLELTNDDGKTGAAVWKSYFNVYEYLTPKRWVIGPGATKGDLRPKWLPSLDGNIYGDGSFGYVPDTRDAKKIFVEHIGEFVKKFIAELREQNSPSHLAKLESYKEYRDSVRGK